MVVRKDEERAAAGVEKKRASLGVGEGVQQTRDMSGIIACLRRRA